MPPWAVPVWERVGYSLEMTAVRTRSEASMAARSPAPPAPTITASYVWTVVTRSRRSRPPAGVEGEDDDRPQRQEPEADHVEEHVHGEPRARPLHVVLHDHPHAVDPHEQPGPQLEAAARPLPPRPMAEGAPGGRRGRPLRGLHGHQRFHPRARFRMSRPMIQVIGTMDNRNTPVDAMDSCFMARVDPGQKSNTMIFTPLMA